LPIAVKSKWPIYQMDVKSDFLNGVLNEEVYVHQPPGFEVKTQEHRVYKLKKAVYGLKQALRTWYNRIDHYYSRMVSVGEKMSLLCISR
jgi:hypothetical protein